MKSTAKIFVAAIATLALSATGGAQQTLPGQHVAFLGSVGGEIVSGGLTGPLNKAAWTLDAGLQVPLHERRLALRSDVMYHWISEYYRYRSAHVISWSADLVARLNDPTVRWSPYLVGGAALYWNPNKADAVTALRMHSAGFQGGIGFEFRAVTTTMFVEYRYMQIAPGGISPVTIGVRF